MERGGLTYSVLAVGSIPVSRRTFALFLWHFCLWNGVLTASAGRESHPVSRSADHVHARPKKIVRAQYDERARPTEGIVKVELTVGEDGRPTAVKVTQKLNRWLDAGAVAAAQQWEFEPSRLDGRPVASTVELEFSFRPPNRRERESVAQAAPGTKVPAGGSCRSSRGRDPGFSEGLPPDLPRGA
jgi:TonB family protein